MTDQNINVIYSVVCLNHKARNIYKKRLVTLSPFILKQILIRLFRLKRKERSIIKKNILGIDIMPEYPIKPDIIVENDFLKNNLKRTSNELIKKIKSIL